MTPRRKRDFPVADVRRFLEPGPIVLVSSAWNGERDVMTFGWHMVLAFEPSLVACYVWDENRSFDLLRRSGECVINLPTAEMLGTVVDIGNCSGRDVDKFDAFGLAVGKARRVGAPLLRDCYANFECRLHDGRQIRRHGLFIREVVKAHVATSPKLPRTAHYRGDGAFMVSGQAVSRRARFRPEML